MRKLLIVVVVLAALGAGVDYASARVFERNVTAALQREYQLGGEPDVRVRDFPFLPDLLFGRVGTIDVRARGLQAEDVTLEELEVHLHDVKIDSALLVGGNGTVQVRSARGEVRLAEAEVRRMAGTFLGSSRLELTRDGVEIALDTTLSGLPVRGTLTGTLDARDGNLVLQPQDLELEASDVPDVLQEQVLGRLAFTLPLPELPADVEVESVRTEPDAVVLTGRARAVTFQP